MVHIIHIGNRQTNLLGKIVHDSGSTWQYLKIIDTKVLEQKMFKGELLVCVDDRDDQFDELRNKIQLLYSDIYPIGFLYFFSPQNDQQKTFSELEEYVDAEPSKWQVAQALHRLLGTIKIKKEMLLLQKELKLRTQELAELNKIGIALSSERELDTLLEQILRKAREITSADAGSLYLIEQNPEITSDDGNYWADKQLRFKLAHNDSIISSYQEFIMPVERKSMAGYTALSARPLNIPDAYNLPVGNAFQHNRSFDDRMGYHTKSVLCLPLQSHQGEMIGVLQLINRKKDANEKLTSIKKVETLVVPFDHHCEELASSLASQAAVSIENMRLYDEIKRLFEGFIVASVHAIEQRDPTTYGHSARVATLTIGLAQQVDSIANGPFRKVSFSREDLQQIKYAALLHDFGKIGIREKILIKAKKLYPEQMESILFRGRFIKKVLELDTQKTKLQKFLDKENTFEQFIKFDLALSTQIQEIDHLLDFIVQTNEPRLLPSSDYEKLRDIGQKSYMADDAQYSLLTTDEIKILSIGRGSLTEEERQEIESHVTNTYNFLIKIPWASHLKAVPQIAFAHHEKLDGTGYPRGLQDAEIPLPAKMIAIADIYDALTAWDRPYKKAVSINKALDILMVEAKEGKLDPDLLHIFIDSKIFHLVSRPGISDNENI